MPEPTGHQAVEKPPRPEVLTARVKFLAQDSEQVIITDHAEERMFERNISAAMLFKALRQGHLKGDVKKGQKKGDWVVKMACRVQVNRDVGIVTAVLTSNKLVIITAEWEDM